MTYYRQEPNDYFNEGKLLICLGYLSQKIAQGDAPKGLITFDNKGANYDIELNDQGFIYVKNRIFNCNGNRLFFGIRLNDHSQTPLYMVFENVNIKVFTEDGELTTEFVKAIEDFKRPNPSNLNSISYD